MTHLKRVRNAAREEADRIWTETIDAIMDQARAMIGAADQARLAAYVEAKWQYTKHVEGTIP